MHTTDDLLGEPWLSSLENALGDSAPIAAAITDGDVVAAIMRADHLSDETTNLRSALREYQATLRRELDDEMERIHALSRDEIAAVYPSPDDLSRRLAVHLRLAEMVLSLDVSRLLIALAREQLRQANRHEARATTEDGVMRTIRLRHAKHARTRAEALLDVAFAPRVCANCGTRFWSLRPTATYCTRRCKERAHDRRRYANSPARREAIKAGSR